MQYFSKERRENPNGKSKLKSNVFLWRTKQTFYGIGIVQSLKVHRRGRCYDIANCNYMPSKNLNYNLPGILNRSIDVKSKTKITKIIIVIRIGKDANWHIL